LRQKFDSTFEDKLASSTIGMNQLPPAFWCVSATEILQHLGTAKEGLSSEEARQRLAGYGSNLLKPQKRSDVLTLLLARLSFFLHDPINDLIILTIVLVSGLLGFWQEHSATNAVEKFLAIVQIKVGRCSFEVP
jgi:P-type Mg2+ transporter